MRALGDAGRQRGRAERLGAADDRGRASSTKLLLAQENERRALARELHDEVGQLLTCLSLLLHRAQVDRNAQPMLLKEARGLVDKLHAYVHDLTLNLRPPLLDDLGLNPALNALIDRFQRQTDIAVMFREESLPEPLPTEVRTAAYRIVQEALTNVARHAGVSSAGVAVAARGTRLHVRVLDSGAGFDVDQIAVGQGGLAGMRERAELLGGRLDVQSAPGKGTRIFALLPLASDDQAPDQPDVA
ncbi:MAG TPA: sensor histidine kinase [Chloroflexota bacterium]